MSYGCPHLWLSTDANIKEIKQTIKQKRSKRNKCSHREMCRREPPLQRTSFLEIFCFVVLYTVFTLKKYYKTGSHLQTKSPRRQVEDTAWVELNRDKLMQHLSLAYSLFYKNSQNRNHMVITQH